MAVETRIYSRRSVTRMEGHDGTAPLEAGPSYMRFVCNITVAFVSRRLGGGGILATSARATPAGRACESTHLVDDPSSFLDFNWTRRAVWFELIGLLGALHLCRLDLAARNWDVFRPDTVATSILQIVQANHDQGVCGGHYRFKVDMDIEVRLAFSEPMALLRHCSEKVRQTPHTDATCDPCGICLDGLTEPSRTPPLNLPCGHAFHSHCITI